MSEEELDLYAPNQSLQAGRHRMEVVDTPQNEEPFKERYIYGHTTGGAKDEGLQQNSENARAANRALEVAELGENFIYSYTFADMTLEEAAKQNIGDGSLLVTFQDGELKIFEAVTTVPVGEDGEVYYNKSQSRLMRRKNLEKIWREDRK